MGAPLPTFSTPDTAHDVVLALMVVLVAAALGWSTWHWRRSGAPTALLLTLGGLVCSMNESLVDVLGQCYFPQDGLMAQEFFDRGVPVWVSLAYMLFFGFFVFVNAEVLKRRPTRKQMWVGIGVFWVLNALLEIPILATGLYEYYGNQPLEVGGFPLAWLTINDIGSFAAAVVVARFSWWFTGARQLLLLPLCYGTYMASWVLSMPYFVAVNAEASMAVTTGAALVSMAAAIWAVDGLIKVGIGGRKAAVDAPYERVLQTA